MKHISYITFFACLFAVVTISCSKNEGGDLTKGELSGLSFSWDFVDDSPYDRTYDLAFVNEETFEFSATAHGTTGNQFGTIVSEYVLSEDAVVFNYGARGFQVGSYYVKPLSGKLLRDVDNKIVGMDVTLRYEKLDGSRVTTSDLSFYVSDYKPSYKPEEPELEKIKEKDLKGTVWTVSKLGTNRHYVILCDDHTTFNFGASWKFDEKTQTLTAVNGEQIEEYKISSGNKDEFTCKRDGDSYTWTRVEDDELSIVYTEIITGSYIDEKGKTLTIPWLEGTAAPALPASTKMNKYESQKMSGIVFEGLKGTYEMHYEGQTWDISKYVPYSWTRPGGTIKISNPLKSSNNFKVSLTGKVSGEFTKD